MPGPGLPSPFAAAVAAGAIRADQVDPDYLYFLQHVRPDGNSYVLELPANGASPAVTFKYETPPAGEAQIASVSVPSPGRASSNRRVEEENPSADTQWYESEANIDEDYREWLRNMRVVDGHMVLELGGQVVHYEVDEARSGGSSKAAGEEKEGVGEVAATAASGEDRVGEGEKVAVISTDGPVLNVPGSHVRDCRAHGQKVEEDQEEKDEGRDGAGKDEEVGLDGPMIVASEPGQKIMVVEEAEKLLNEPAVETLNSVNREVNLSNGHDAEPHVASGFHGVVWPTHIVERPESGFKERLMHVLSKPFSREEYDKLVGRATIRIPVRKERRTRRGVKYYYSTHEKNKSYFDSFPDLAKQVEGTSYPNRLALLRGFFFWLENVGHEDQFRPWRDDFTHYKVISSME